MQGNPWLAGMLTDLIEDAQFEQAFSRCMRDAPQSDASPLAAEALLRRVLDDTLAPHMGRCVDKLRALNAQTDWTGESGPSMPVRPISQSFTAIWMG